MDRGNAPWWLSILTLIVGLGVGYLLWGDAAPADDASTTLEVDGTPDAGTGSAETLRGAEGPAVMLDAKGSVDPLARVVRGGASVEPVRGTGRIHGKVLDATGKPVAGVQMRIDAVGDRHRFYPAPFDGDPETQLLQRIRGMVEMDRWQRAYRQMTTTSADGSYAFEQLADVKFRVSGILDGWLIQPSNHQHYRGVGVGSEVNFGARAQARVRLEFVGKTPTKALTVTFKQGNSTRGMQWSPAKPVLDVQPGSYEVLVNGGAHGELRAGPIALDLVAGAEPAVVKVELTESPVLNLKIAFPEGEAMTVETWILRVEDRVLPDESVLRARGRQENRWRYGHMGGGSEVSIEVKDLEEGTYAVGVARLNVSSMAAMELVDLRPGLVKHTIDVPPLDPKAYVIVAVRNAEGTIIPNAQIQTGWFGERGSSSGGSTTASRPDGRLLVMHQRVSDERAASGTYWVQATVPGQGSKAVTYRPDKDREIELAFEAPADVAFEVAGVAGTPYEGRVSFTIRAVGQAGHGGHNRTHLDAHGKATLRGVQPGEYELNLHIKAGRHRDSAIHAEAVTIRPGENRLRISMPTLYTVTVRGASGTCVVQPEREPGKPRQHRTSIWGEADGKGNATFDTLKAGTYTASSAGKRAKFTVPGTRAVTLERLGR